MARKFIQRDSTDIEEIVKECLLRVGILNVNDDKIALLTRLIFSGISSYFFSDPDNLINMGFLQFKKNPIKDELFSINIIRNTKEGVVNAETLWKYYKGELAKESELKKIIDSFVMDLLSYSREQESNISNLTKKLN